MVNSSKCDDPLWYKYQARSKVSSHRIAIPIPTVGAGISIIRTICAGVRGVRDIDLTCSGIGVEDGTSLFDRHAA